MAILARFTATGTFPEPAELAVLNGLQKVFAYNLKCQVGLMEKKT